MCCCCCCCYCCCCCCCYCCCSFFSFLFFSLFPLFLIPQFDFDRMSGSNPTVEVPVVQMLVTVGQLKMTEVVIHADEHDETDSQLDETAPFSTVVLSVGEQERSRSPLRRDRTRSVQEFGHAQLMYADQDGPCQLLEGTLTLTGSPRASLDSK